MTSAPAPEPAVMPVDRELWFRHLDLSNFVNAYYQFRDVSRFDNCRRVLIVGPGQGLQTEVLKWRGFDVTTLDIDETFKPDVVGSVHDMSLFKDGEFDAVIASHVLEHLAVTYLDPALSELSRVATHALIYLPVAGRHVQARFQPGFKGIDLSLVVDVFNYLHRPSGVEPKYCGGQHFWEVGMRGFRVRDVTRRMASCFDVLDVYRNRDWNPSVNFVLRSRRLVAR
jgi:methyltransferase family protein